MKALSPKLRAKHRRLLNFMLSPEFTKLSAANGHTFSEPQAKKKPASESTSKKGNHYGTWCIDTSEGMLIVNATFTKRANGKMRYRSRWSFVPASMLGLSA
jgi:hypothetical protein